MLWNWPWLATWNSGARERLETISASHGWDPNAIAAVIDIESKGNPAATNKLSGATGLIQFIPSTAKSLETTTDDLREMSASEQLPFVERYFLKTLGATVPSDPGDYYLATFMPAYLGRADSDVIARKGEKVYDQNSILDSDKNGELTVGDVRAVLNRVYNSAAAGSFPTTPVGQVPRGTSHLSTGQGTLVAVGLLLAVGFIFVRTLRSAAAGARI